MTEALGTSSKNSFSITRFRIPKMEALVKKVMFIFHIFLEKILLLSHSTNSTKQKRACHRKFSKK